MAELIIMPDAEAVLVSYFNAQLPSTAFPTVKAHTKVPATRPERFFKFVAVGGFDSTLVTAVPRVVMETYAPTEASAVQMQALGLALLGAAALDGSMGATTVHSLSVVSRPQNLPDPNVTTSARYSSTFELHMRAA